MDLRRGFSLFGRTRRWRRLRTRFSGWHCGQKWALRCVCVVDAVELEDLPERLEPVMPILGRKVIEGQVRHEPPPGRPTQRRVVLRRGFV